MSSLPTRKRPSSKRSYKKRPAKRRRVYKKLDTSMTIPGGAGKLIPDELHTKMLDTTYQVMNLNAVIINALVIRPTSIYDPEYAFGGGQPSGYALYAQMYAKYQVKGFKCEAWFSRNSNTNSLIQLPMIVFIGGMNQTQAGPTGRDQVTENDRFTWKLMPLNQAGVGSGPQHLFYLKKYFSTKELLGYYNESDMISAFGSNPNVLPYVYVGATLADGSAGNNGNDFYVSVLIKMTFYVKLFGKIIPVDA